MKKWSLQPDPSPRDPDQHILLVQAEMAHIHRIIKKFGATCGRPLRIQDPEGFNFSIRLHHLTPLGLDKVSRFLKDMAPDAVADGRGATAPAAAPLAEPPSAAAAELPPSPASAPDIAIPPLTGPFTEAPAPSAPPALEVPRPPSIPPTMFAPIPAAVVPSPAAPAARPLWGLQSPLDPGLNFDTFSVGAYNRFAHAAATSVVGSPGTMYNPLFIYGGPAVGKTHVLHAIAAVLMKGWEESAVVMTTGAGLAAAANAALAAGQIAPIEERLAGAKALLVDDVHLLAISEKNQSFLAKIFQDCFARNAQVVLTSVYPPRTMGAMEDALKISLAKGWAVDMKVPNPQIQVDMIHACAERRGFGIGGVEVKKLHEQMGPNYGEFPRLLARWQALAGLYQAKGASPGADEMVADLLAPGARACQGEVPSAADLAGVQNFALPAPGPDARNLALFCPRGQDAMVSWMAACFHRAGTEFGAPGTYRVVLCESYDTEQPLGTPFQIGESCQRVGAQAALVLGPPRESKLAAREAEFAHAVSHILESFGVATGWIPFGEASVTRPFLAAHLDFIAFPRA